MFLRLIINHILIFLVNVGTLFYDFFLELFLHSISLICGIFLFVFMLGISFWPVLLLFFLYFQMMNA